MYEESAKPKALQFCLAVVAVALASKWLMPPPWTFSGVQNPTQTLSLRQRNELDYLVVPFIVLCSCCITHPIKFHEPFRLVLFGQTEA